MFCLLSEEIFLKISWYFVRQAEMCLREEISCVLTYWGVDGQKSCADYWCHMGILQIWLIDWILRWIFAVCAIHLPIFEILSWFWGKVVRSMPSHFNQTLKIRKNFIKTQCVLILTENTLFAEHLFSIHFFNLTCVSLQKMRSEKSEKYFLSLQLINNKLLSVDYANSWQAF